LIYVEINFCNYFSDINYEDIIDKEHLPINFDAKREIIPEKHLMIGSYNTSKIYKETLNFLIWRVL